MKTWVNHQATLAKSVRFRVFTAALMLMIVIARCQDFDGDFGGFDNFDGANFGGQDTTGFDSSSFDGFSAQGGGDFGGADFGPSQFSAGQFDGPGLGGGFSNFEDN